MTIEPKLPQFKTQRLLIKPITIEDAPSYQQYFSNEKILEQIQDHIPHPYPKDGALDYIQNHLLPEQGKTLWAFGLFLKTKPNELIGCIEIRKASPTGNRGVWLAHHLWGNGLMQEALWPVTQFVFDKLQFKKLILYHNKNNMRSKKLKLATHATYVKSETVHGYEKEVWELHSEAFFKSKR